MSGGCEFAWESDGFAWVLPGGGAVMSVNGDTGPDVLLDAGDIPSTGAPSASNVQADLDLAVPITTAAELELRYPAAGNVHQIDQGVVFQLRAGATEIDIGSNQIELLFPVRLEGRGSKVPVVSDADGPLVFGVGSIDNIIVRNVGVGASAQCISLSSATTFIEVTNCALVGQDPGIIQNAVIGVIMRNNVIVPLADGAKPLTFDGTLGQLIIDKLSVSTFDGTTPRTAVEFLATAVVSGLALDRVLYETQNSGDFLFSLNASLTLPPDETIGSLACSIVGPGTLFDPAGFNAASPEIISTAQRNGENSRWLGDASFTDSVTPIVVTHAGAPTWDVMPSENVGPTSVLTENTALNQRFALVVRALQDWGMEGTGRTDKKFGFAIWSATVARSGGGAARPFSGRIETRPDNLSPWVALAESEAAVEMAGSSPTTISKSAPVLFDRLTEFRLTVQGTIATSTGVSAYSIAPSAS